MRRCGRACRRTTTARGLVPPTRATNARTAAARLRARPQPRPPSLGSHSHRARRPGRLPRRSRERCRQPYPQLPTTTMSQASRAALPARSATVSTRWCAPASSWRAGDAVHDVARPPDVLDGRAVELEVDGRRIDAGALVGRGHGDAQHVAVAERRAGFGLRRAECRGCRVGHREARAPVGAIADSVDGATTRACGLRRTAPLPAARWRGPRQAVRQRAQRRRRGWRPRRYRSRHRRTRARWEVARRRRPRRARSRRPRAACGRSQHRERNAGRDLAAHVGAADGAVRGCRRRAPLQTGRAAPDPRAAPADTASRCAARTSRSRSPSLASQTFATPDSLSPTATVAQTSSRCQSAVERFAAVDPGDARRGRVRRRSRPGAPA